MSRTVPVAGTLVVAVATNTGLLVCADKRTYDPIRGDRDNDVKITRLSTTSLLTSTGYTKFYEYKFDPTGNRLSLNLLFDADQVAREFWRTHSFQEKDVFWSVLAQAYVTGFEDYLSRSDFKDWPSTGNPPDETLFQVQIFFVSKEGPGLMNLRFHYAKVQPPRISVTGTRELTESFKAVKPLLLGNLAVPRELQSGMDPRFDDLRSEKTLISLLKDRPAVQAVTLGEAKQFAVRLIRVASERTSLLDESPFHIGPKCDCAFIDRVKGFRWLNGAA